MRFMCMQLAVRAVPVARGGVCLATPAWLYRAPPCHALLSRSASSSAAPPRTPSDKGYMLPHPLWKGEYVDGVEITHREPVTNGEKLALQLVRLMRFNFDWISGYSWRQHTPSIWLNRIMFLESVAGVPGSVAATLRHLRSLRQMKRDHGWIHTLLEEAENERMHLMCAVSVRKPSPLLRAGVWISQGIFFNFFFLSYLVSSRFAHAFVGYLEEEAVITYTKCLTEIDTPGSSIAHWKTEAAPAIAKDYWKLPDNATVRDMIAVIRADEAHHREVNQKFTCLRYDEDNPFPAGY